MKDRTYICCDLNNAEEKAEFGFFSNHFTLP